MSTSEAPAAGGFMPFLSQDNLDLSNPQTQAVIQATDQDLEQLLRLPPAQFWHVVLSDDSLHTCLDSFLRFKRRCYDVEGPDSIQGSSDVLLQLSQRVFRVYWRMVHLQEQQDTPSSAAAASSSSSKQQPQYQQKQQQHKSSAAAATTQPPPPTRSQVSDLLYNKWLLDVPKMLDLAVLYAPGSSQLVQELLHQLLMLQPKYAQDILTLSAPLTANLHELLESVKQLGNQVLSPTAASSQQLLPELAEAVSYFIDACLTLQALVECLPEAAALLLHPHNHGELLIVLAAIHSSTVPLLHRVSQQPAAAAVPGLAPGRIHKLQLCLEAVVFHLLRSAYCTKQGAFASGGPAAVAAQAAALSPAAAAGAGAASSSSSSSSLRSTPAAAAAASGFSSEVQGQELMNLLMLLAHPSDGVGGGGHTAAADGKGNLLAAVNHAHHLDVAVSSAVSEGLLALDDAQFDYFLALVDGDRQLLQQRQQQQQQQWATSQQGASSSSSSSRGPAGNTAGTASVATQQPAAAELKSMVSSIKELLPDYGDGFLTAALHHNSYSTEQTINCLLEGSLPAALQGLDPGLKTWSPPAPAAAAGGAGAGGAGASSSAGLSWTGLAREAAAAAAPQRMAERIPLPSLTAAAAAGPKAGIDKRTSRVLGALGGRVLSVTKNIAQEMQFEYDDEYDDSFDDLRGPGNDGVCDIEGEDAAAAGAGGVGTGGGRGGGGAAASSSGGDMYADEPPTQGGPQSGRRPPGPQQQQQQLRGPRQQQQQRKEKLWVLDGRVYNYKKPGAVEVEGQAGAQAALKAAQQAAEAIHGLGPGGNVPLPVPAATAANEQQQRPQRQQPVPSQAAAGGAAGGSGGAGRGGAAGGGRGRGREGGGGGRGHGQEEGGEGGGRGGGGRGGRGRGSYASKEQHKAAVGNHHRRDRALQKQARGML